MPRKLIALDARLYAGKGAGDSTYWTNLANALADLESEFDFVLLSNAPRPPNVPAGLGWEQLPNAPSRWLSLVSLPLKARKLGATGFHTQYNLSPLARSGITTIHDVSFFVGPEWFSFRDRVLLQKFVPASARRAKAVITVSETSKRDMLKYIPDIADKVFVSPLAASPEFRPFDQQQSSETLQKLGVSEPFLLTAGTRWARKNIELAVDACERLPDSIPHRLVVAGHAEPARSNRTIQLGWVEHDDLLALFGRAALYICPSRYEGFGLPIVEAFAAGAPVIASTGGAIPEIAGGAAVIVESFDATDWMEAIRAVLSDSSNLSAMKERGFRRAKDFSWKQTAIRTLEAYHRAAQ